MIRVLVVEDSVTVRARLCEVLGADREIEVIGEAGDGMQAIDLCVALRPDVVTLDMMLPVMSGLAATEYIMAHVPTPILIVSASTNRGELFKTYDALAAGALDVMDKSPGVEGDAEWERRFVATVKLLSRISVITHPRARLGARMTPRDTELVHRDAPPPAALPARFRIVALGASTGGPAALLMVLRHLPADFPIPIVVVLHIGEPFGLRFAEWFDGQTLLHAQFAAGGERIAGPGIWFAPPDRHIVVHGSNLALTDSPERHSCRPSVDVLFESVASEFGASAIAGLLTGMGRDGASGLLAIRRAGGFTFAQDEASSVVYGMPREAALLGAADRVVPLSGVETLLTALTRQSGVRRVT